MNVNLVYDSEDLRSGYLNIVHIGDHRCIDKVDFVKGDVTFFDAYVSPGEAEYLLTLDVLTYFPGYAVEKLLDYWLSKLAINGEITIGDVDAVAVGKALYERTISLADANMLLHGSQTQPWLLRKTSLCLEGVTEYFESRGLRITAKKLDGFNFLVTAKRVM